MTASSPGEPARGGRDPLARGAAGRPTGRSSRGGADSERQRGPFEHREGTGECGVERRQRGRTEVSGLRRKPRTEKVPGIGGRLAVWDKDRKKGRLVGELVPSDLFGFGFMLLVLSGELRRSPLLVSGW